jgi:hypothetical protein
MSYIGYPALALLTFVIGVAVSPIHFELLGWGCGRTYDGGGFTAYPYRSSYFIRVDFTRECYLSAETANHVFDERVKEAAKIVELTPNTNGDGVIVGKRTVAVDLDKNNRPYTTIFWTNGRTLCSIDSSSWLHAIEFEKRHKYSN